MVIGAAPLYHDTFHAGNKEQKKLNPLRCGRASFTIYIANLIQVANTASS
jgi:hypothetical protein